MSNNKETMTSKQNRCYDNNTCPYHEIIQDTVNKALPKWVFVSSVGTIVAVALIFAGWHVKSLQAFDNKYQQEVMRFNAIAIQNKEILVEVRTELRLLQNRLREDRERDNLQRFDFHGKTKEKQTDSFR